METLEELKDKYYKLDAERYNLFREIIKLESQETLKIVNIGDCFINTCHKIAIKIVAVRCKELHCLYIDRDSIHLVKYMPDDIMNTCMTSDYMFLHISSDKCTMKRKHQCN